MYPRPVEPFNERAKLRRRQTHHTIGDRRPFERALFQPLPDQHQAAAVPYQNLDPVGTATAERTSRAPEKGSCARISRKTSAMAKLSAPLRKSSRPRRDQHPDAGQDRDHIAALTARSTSRRCRQSTPVATRITAPANSISTLPALDDAVPATGVASPAVAMIGTNPISSSAGNASDPDRASRRHAPYTCCGRSLHSVSAFPPTRWHRQRNEAWAVIRPLSSSDHDRRPPTPLITSSRRTPTTSLGFECRIETAARKSISQNRQIIVPSTANQNVRSEHRLRY